MWACFCLFLTASCFSALPEYFLLYSPPGSIHFLKATELHVLVESTNQNLCVRYSFKNELAMRSPSGEKVSVVFSVVICRCNWIPAVSNISCRQSFSFNVCLDPLSSTIITTHLLGCNDGENLPKFSKALS